MATSFTEKGPIIQVSSIDLSIITVTYQSREFIDACILSVIAHTVNCTYEHIIVDNHSTDGTVEFIEKWHSLAVHLIKNEENKGFAFANNQALKAAKGRYILFLNPDMEIRDGSLGTLLDWMGKRPEVGLAGCKLLDRNNQVPVFLQPHKFPKLWPYVLSFLNIRPFFCSIHPTFFYSTFDGDKEQEVDVVRGAFMLTRKKTLDQLGFAFDPRYFILFEDLDLCREMKRLNLQVVYTPLVSCVDYFGQSFFSQTQPWKYLQMLRSFKTYVRKWHSSLHLVWINILGPIGFMLRHKKTPTKLP